MHWLSRTVTIVVLVGLAAAVGILIYTRVGEHEVGGGFRTSAAFRDASKLPIGSRVMIAGVHIGEITALTVDGRLARVSMRLRDDIELWNDAWAEKRSESLFGDGYIEVHPGGGPGSRRLRSGEPIPRVVEGASTDRTLRTIEEAMPTVESTLGGSRRFFLSARELVNGPAADRLAGIEQSVHEEKFVVPLHDFENAVDRFDRWTAGVASDTADLQPRAQRALGELADDVAGARDDLREGRKDIHEAMATARQRIDEVDPYVHDVARIVRRLDGQVPPEEQGTLGRMINDPTTADDIEDTSTGIRSFTNSLDRLQTFVGLRYEYGFRNQNSRLYVGAEIWGRPDSFAVFEVVKTSQGDVPEVSLSDDPASEQYVRTAIIRDEVRLTGQWGRNVGPFRARFGIKESAFGVGADAILLGGGLKVSADLFGSNFVRAPNLRLAAALRVFEAIYVIAGLDDVLTAPGEFPIVAGADDVPQQLRELKYGRDVFAGVFFRFDDEDLNKLLLLYGAVIFAAL